MGFACDDQFRLRQFVAWFFPRLQRRQAPAARRGFVERLHRRHPERGQSLQVGPQVTVALTTGNVATAASLAIDPFGTLYLLWQVQGSQGFAAASSADDGQTWMSLPPIAIPPSYGAQLNVPPALAISPVSPDGQTVTGVAVWAGSGQDGYFYSAVTISAGTPWWATQVTIPGTSQSPWTPPQLTTFTDATGNIQYLVVFNGNQYATFDGTYQGPFSSPQTLPSIQAGDNFALGNIKLGAAYFPVIVDQNGMILMYDGAGSGGWTQPENATTPWTNGTPIGVCAVQNSLTVATLAPVPAGLPNNGIGSDGPPGTNPPVVQLGALRLQQAALRLA